jgi:ADP-dependent NAD(P)H-hydrate dehydratase
MQFITTLPPLPDRPDESHKGTFGKVLLVAGSQGMSGAAILSGLGALRGGAGLVYLAVPESILPIVASAEPSYLTIPLPDDFHAASPALGGSLTTAALETIRSSLAGKDAAGLGPGLGQSQGVR